MHRSVTAVHVHSVTLNSPRNSDVVPERLLPLVQQAGPGPGFLRDGEDTLESKHMTGYQPHCSDVHCKVLVTYTACALIAC